MPPSRRISTGNTALHEAAEAGNLEAALMLVDEGGANVEARTYREGKTPLATAAKFGNEDIAEVRHI